MAEAVNFGRYRLRRLLGKGSTASVYLAESGTDTVALKIIHQHLSLDPVVRERLQQEVALARRLSHPAVVTIHDLISHDGRDAIVMAYCPGGNLTAQAVPDAAQARLWLTQLAAALGAAHRLGLVHRAVKPENILFDAAGQARLGDFGSARWQSLIGLTTSTSYLATPLYIAPEVMLGAPCAPDQDLYSLGAVFYQVLAGRPHREPSLAALLTRQAGAVVPLGQLRPDLPAALTSLIDDLLAASGRRPAHATAIAARLEGRQLSAAAETKACLYCQAALPPDAAICQACGQPDIFLPEKPTADAEVIVLVRLPEDAATMGRLTAFIQAWSGKPWLIYKFVTENVHLYSKHEAHNAKRLPWPLLSEVDPETSLRIIRLLEADGTSALHLERWPLARAMSLLLKKAPLLETRRPQRFRPLGGPLPGGLAGWLDRASSSDLSELSGCCAPPASPDPAVADRWQALALDCRRLAASLPPADPTAALIPPRLEELLARSRIIELRLAEQRQALAAVTPADLYTEATRLRLQAEAGASLDSLIWQDLLERQRVNRQAWQRYVELEEAYSRGLERLTATGLAIKRLLAAVPQGSALAETLADCRALIADLS